MDMFRKILRRSNTQDKYQELRERESRELVGEGEDDVEGGAVHETSGRQVSGHLPDGLAKQFLDKPGIPMPPIPRFRATLCFRWLILVFLLIGSLYWLGRFLTVQSFHDITSVKNIELDVDNCDVELSPMPPKLEHSAVTIQYWKFMSQIHRISTEDDTMTIQVDMRAKVPMFRCLISIFTNESKLEKLSGHIGGTQHCRLIMLEAISKEVELTSQQVSVQLKALPKKVHLTSSDGLVALRPRTVPDGWDATIKASRANVLVEVPSSFTLDLAGESEKHTVLAGEKLDATTPGQYQMHAGHGSKKGKLKFDFESEAAGYVKAGDAIAPKDVVAGSQHDTPSFFNASMAQLDELSKWIERRADGVAPWVARFHLNGPNLPQGSWEVLSSEAFLTVPLQWYVLLSAGTLRPKVSEVHLHPMGMKAWPTLPTSNSTKNTKKTSIDETLLKSFEMLRPYVEKANAPGATFAWVPHEGRPIVFTKATNKWSHAELSYTQVNVLMLLIAVTFNIVVSVLVAAYVINWLQINADFQLELKEAAVTIASSHRIGKLSGKNPNSSWRIIAAHVEQPDQGVILRWRKRTGVQSSAYLCVKAKADPDPARGLDGDEICINMAVQERVDMKSESNIIIEFFFSASGSKGYPPEGGYEPTGKDLKCQYSYRFQVEGYNNHEELVAVSDWSNEVYIKARSSVFDVPSRILQVNCAVPTDSLEFFVEHFAQFNIEGKHPQHLVILSDIKVCYHKNWRDFRDWQSDFLLTAWMGETSARCERETRAGTCRSFDKTGIFRPPDDVVQGDVDDEEERRTQELNNAVPGRPTLCVGGADRKLCDLFITLRKSSGEDVAEGKLEWDDLIEAFDKYEQSNEISEDQSIFVELATDKVEGEFDEEWLVWVEARVTFKNELDPKCVEMPYHKRIFQLDPPGQIFYEGMERFMAWDASSLQMNSGDEDMKSFDIYMTYPENPDLERLLLAENVQVTNGGVSVMITFPDSVNANHIVAQLFVEGFNDRGESVMARSSMEAEPLPSLSHRFIICRTWTLADFELMYASFCRMNSMEMERVTEEALQEYGMVLAREQLKVCSGLRKPLIFEEIAEEEVIDCPGLIMVSGDNISARSALGPAVDLTGGGSDAGGSILRTISSAKSPFLGTSTASPSGRKGANAGADVIDKREYRSTFQSIGFLENAWPRYPHPLDMAYGTGWMPSFLLLNSFYPVDNILNAIKAGANALALPVAYDTVRAIGGRYLADSLLRVATAPLYGLVPYLCEAFLYLLQMFSFLVLPFLLLFFGLCYEFVGMFFALNPEASEYAIVDKPQSHIPDMTFSAVVSGRSVEEWMMGLSSVSLVALLGSTVTANLMIFLICESNFLRNLPPPAIQHAIHQIMNSMGSMLVSSYIWVLLSFVISSVLWFGMVVVIYPEQMLTALACAGGLATVFTTMLTGLKNTKDELERMLREEIPEVLELVCDSFLEHYDKTSSGTSKRVIATYRKLEEELAERTHSYVKHRLDHNTKLKQDVFQDEKRLPKEALGCLFTRALVKSKLWKDILWQEQNEEEANQNPELAVQTTDTVLESLGLPQEDTTQMHYLDLRMRLEDKEREEGGENIHKFGPDLQQKLMKVYVRMQDVHMEAPQDVGEALSNPKRLAKCMHRANLAKFKTLEHAKDAGSKSSLQICIQSLNEEKVDQLDLFLVEHLDETLSQVEISEMVTPFVETTIPAEVQKQVRFALDMTRQDSNAQQLYDQLRRKKNSIPRKQVKQRLTLNRQDDPDGLMSFLADIGIVERTAQKRKAAHYNGLFHRVEGLVSEWKREDEEGHEVKDPIVDPRDLEGFVHELLKHRIWWGAMESILKNIGFPMTVDGSGNSVSREVVMKEFEAQSVKDGFLPADKMLDFLRKVSRADVADGAAGRLWKGEMVMLMQHLKICGFVGKQVRTEAVKKTKSKVDQDVDIADDGLPEMAQQEWPEWMVRAWARVAPPLPHNEEARPFLPRTLIYKFIKEIAFAREEHVRTFKEREADTYEKLKIIDEEYDTWKKEEGEGPKYIWVNRGKSLLRVRAIWQECFLELLTKVGNPVQDIKEGLLLFHSALQDQKAYYSGDLTDMEGLLAVDYLHTWLQKNLVERTTEVSLQIFKAALQMAEFTLPPSSVEALWYSADKAQMVGSKTMERASLRQVKDLEDRLVMYLSGGMFYESLRGLIVNELHVPSLHSLDAKEIAAAFKQVDEKTGCCGVIDPHEVSELLLLLSQEGMDLAVVQQSFDQLRVHLDHEAVQDAFMMVDTNCDDKIDLTEFLSLIDRMVEQIIPDAIFEYMGLQRYQIFWGVILKVLTILTMFLFVFVSLNAFHVDVGEKAASAGSSSIRAALAGLALLGLRNDNSPEYMEKQANIAKEQLYRITSVSRSQLEARRRSNALNAAGARMARRSNNSGGGVTLTGGGGHGDDDEEEADAH